jgi:branched-chain amino acid transport system permease protein
MSDVRSAQGGRDTLIRYIRDAGGVGLLALAIFVPFIGLRLHGETNGLVLHYRPKLLVIGVVLAMLARLLVLIWQERRVHQGRAAWRAARVASAGKYVAPLFLASAALLPLVPGIANFYIDLGVLVMTYVMLGWGLNIVVGLAGLLDLGYVAFYAVGAYSFALLAHYYHLTFWECLPLSGIFAAIWGMCLGFPVLRLRGDYLAIVTLAFGEIIRLVITNWISLTGGPNGIYNIPHPTFFGLNFNLGGGPGTFSGFFGIDPDPKQLTTYLYYIIFFLALLTNWVTLRLRRLPMGRAWEALREDEIACRSLGINVRNTKLTAFAIGAMFGGFAGCFFATRQNFISPDSFTFIESATVLAIVVLGGAGSQLGVALAAVVMIGIPALLQDLSIYRMLFFGLALAIMMVVRPRGFVSTRTPSIALGKRQQISSELMSEGHG